MLHFMSSCLHLTHHKPKQHFASPLISLLNLKLLIYFLFPLRVQVPGVMSVRPATSGTLRWPVGAACPASATATSTCTTQGRVTPGQAPVSSACTTLRATRVSTASWVTTATLPLRAAGVSTDENVTPLTYCMYTYIYIYYKLERDNFSPACVPSKTNGLLPISLRVATTNNINRMKV